MSNKENKNYEWNQETIADLRFMSTYLSEEVMESKIAKFVDLDCQLEDGDCVEDLITSLTNKVYKK